MTLAGVLALIVCLTYAQEKGLVFAHRGGSMEFEENTMAAIKLGAKRVGCRVDLTSRAQVRAAQKAGLRVSCWPGRTVEDYEPGMALGVDALCPVHGHSRQGHGMEEANPLTLNRNLTHDLKAGKRNTKG